MDEHIKQVDYFEFRNIYKMYKAGNPKYQERFFENYHRKLTLYEAAERYLKDVMNGRTDIPITVWRKERASLVKEREILSREYDLLKKKTQESETIERHVDNLTREVVQRTRDLELRGERTVAFHEASLLTLHH